MYHCGPTVYGRAHIGNLRSFTTWDLLRRALVLNGYKVTQVMNVTDVDDKTIKRSQEEGVSLRALTDRYTKFFEEDIATLNILTPHKLVRATDHIDEMVELIETLLRRGLAYKGEDNSVYFKISAFKKYGELAGLKNIQLKQGARIVHDEYEKEDAQDFVLWKAWNKDDGNVFWETSLGKGRPGWHIECSAMSMKYLGEGFDIHTGGKDLIFPHHENEIAQSEGATEKSLARYWLHNEFVLVDGKKMAKSEGNIMTLTDIVKKEFTPLSYRYFLLQVHYRTQVNFTWEALEASEHALKKLYEQYRALGEDIGEESAKHVKKFKQYIGDNLDTPRALALVWDILKDKTVAPKDKKKTLILFDAVLGLGLEVLKKEEIPAEVLEIAERREEARKKEDWAVADTLRKEIENLGFEIKDTEQGPRITKK